MATLNSVEYQVTPPREIYGLTIHKFKLQSPGFSTIYEFFKLLTEIFRINLFQTSYLLFSKKTEQGTYWHMIFFEKFVLNRPMSIQNFFSFFVNLNSLFISKETSQRSYF